MASENQEIFRKSILCTGLQTLIIRILQDDEYELSRANKVQLGHAYAFLHELAGLDLKPGEKELIDSL